MGGDGEDEAAAMHIDSDNLPRLSAWPNPESPENPLFARRRLYFRGQSGQSAANLRKARPWGQRSARSGRDVTLHLSGRKYRRIGNFPIPPLRRFVLCV